MMVCLLVYGCSTNDFDRLAVKALQPLRVGNSVLAVDTNQVEILSSARVLAMDHDMRVFVARFANPSLPRQQQLVSLHQSLKSPGLWPITYVATADGTAIQAFHAREANCLSYAHLFVALAREAGLNARYQWVKTRPKWTRMGERVALRLHVNVVVEIRRGERFVVDIDPLMPWDVADAISLSDDDAKALHLNNLAMHALAKGDLETAWFTLVTALDLSPELAPLWVNLGVLYRQSDQFDAAEASYREALRLDPRDRSALTNLLSLYEQRGLEDKLRGLQDRVEKYQAANPFYHAYLGDLAFEEGDAASAIKHYEQAIALAPKNSGLLFVAGSIRFKSGDLDGAEKDFEAAADNASLGSDLALFERMLDEVRQTRLREPDNPIGLDNEQ